MLPDPPSGPGEVDDVDHCLCGLEHIEGEATPDEDLPPAAGGIEAAQEALADESDVDGCDVDFTAEEPTSDEELPVTVGGM